MYRHLKCGDIEKASEIYYFFSPVFTMISYISNCMSLTSAAYFKVLYFISWFFALFGVTRLKIPVIYKFSIVLNILSTPTLLISSVTGLRQFLANAIVYYVWLGNPSNRWKAVGYIAAFVLITPC